MTEDTSTRATKCNAMRTQSSDRFLGTSMTSNGPSHPDIFPFMNYSSNGSYDGILSSNAASFALSTDSTDTGVMLSPVPTPVEFNMTTPGFTLQSFTPHQSTTLNFISSYPGKGYMEQSVPPGRLLEDNPLNIKQEQSESLPEVTVRYQSQEDWRDSLAAAYLNSPRDFKERNEDVTKEKLYKFWGFSEIESPIDTESSVPLEDIPSSKHTILAKLPKSQEIDSYAVGERKRKRENEDSRHGEVQDDRCIPKSAKRQSRHTKPGRPTVSIPKLVVKGELGRQNLSKEELGERHKACEKRRRRFVREGFDNMRGLMSESWDGRPTDAEVLEAAAELIKDLQEGNKELKAQVIALEERKEHQQ